MHVLFENKTNILKRRLTKLSHEARGMDGGDIIKKAFTENWILMTNDKDFGGKIYRPPQNNLDRSLPQLALKKYLLWEILPLIKKSNRILNQLKNAYRDY